MGGTAIGSDAFDIQTALDALTTINTGLFANTPYSGNVTVTPNATDTAFFITFGGQLQDQTLALIATQVTAGPGTATPSLVRSGYGEPTDVYTIYFDGPGTVSGSIPPYPGNT